MNNWKSLICKDFSWSLQGSKKVTAMRPVSIESTLLLFLLIKIFLAKTNLMLICTMLYHPLIKLIRQEMLITFLDTRPNIHFFKNVFSLQHYMNRGTSHIRQRKFKHIFQEARNPFCECGSETQTATHDIVNCPIYRNERLTLWRKNCNGKHWYFR